MARVFERVFPLIVAKLTLGVTATIFGNFALFARCLRVLMHILASVLRLRLYFGSAVSVRLDHDLFGVADRVLVVSHLLSPASGILSLFRCVLVYLTLGLGTTYTNAFV